MAWSDDARAQGSHSSCGTCFLRVPAHVYRQLGTLPSFPSSLALTFCVCPLPAGVAGAPPLNKVRAFW